MDIHRLFLIKINLIVLVIAISSLFIAYRFICGKEKIKNKKIPKPLTFIFAAFFLIFGLLAPYRITLDSIFFNEKEVTATVVQTIRSLNSGFFYEKIILEKEKGYYYVILRNPMLFKGKTYHIVYATRSKIIFEAQEVIK